MFNVSKVLQFPQPTLQCILENEFDVGLISELPLLGGILSDTRHVWHAKGPCLEVRNTKTGIKVGAWTFGCVLKDSNTKVVCVEEIQRINGMLSLLAVALDCTISGGLICIFDVFSSKVIRAIQIKEKITCLHVVDSSCEVLNLPGPLRNFDGIVSVGTEGGNVYLIDICRQICEEAFHSATIRDELCPCHLKLLTIKDIPKIEYYKERSVRDGDHLAIHLNVVLNSSTDHFTLKGPKGDDRIFVNKEEVIVSALYYCSQLTSLLVGFNFGAFQLWDLTTLNLVYTSPVCDDHIPVTHFALQEPTDDPRAFCYIWVSFSNIELYHAGLPYAVMYSLSYESKEFHEGYGYLYQDFQSCSIRFQVELGLLEPRAGCKGKGGMCVALRPICKAPVNKDLYSRDVTGDILALCAISWTVWFSQTETQTYMLIFDLNQWYKEQMPDFSKWSDCSNYILRVNISDLIIAARKGGQLLNLKIDDKSLRQFSGVQRLEEHFCPNALSFDLWALRENDVILLHNEGLQRALLSQIEAAGPLCLIRPSDIYRQIISLGLTPLFTEAPSNLPISTDNQREIILNMALEHQLVGWLCKCASEWANGSFSSAGCSLDFLFSWAFQRAIVLKTHCDRYCTSLFDYSHLNLDNNTSILLNNCIRQINNLSVFYSYILNKLYGFVSNLELVIEQQTSLKMVSIYFEVLQWLVNVGLLPECHPSTYPRSKNVNKISAPYPVQELMEYYHKKRAQLQMLTKETFISSDSLLFIDNLVNNKCGAELIQRQWQEDGGSGLYPPPSLQSLLRTYLVEGADISHKHSLIIYVFLDLAMALDQSSYSSVITHLIKFPAVFKVSSSIIKITQAFWQLDHGDFTTAMEQLLDPFILGDDLQPWHHAIAMRALLLQDQYNFALLYMQVRKPPITNEKDVLTAISLFIANNMLDEAFYFKNRHQNNNEEKLLMHLFNECNKNRYLHVLLYKCLDTNEEKAFFKYLKSVETPTTDDLQVFYYLLRSRFIEAFDAHQSSKRKKHEAQGLIGQQNASKTDQIVRIFKTLLPDVNKNIVDVIRKERTNLWKEVARPTPLSVFVHNINEQVQYKSTVIHAALVKAKHTFNDTLLADKVREIVTEETPFLRTPKVSRINARHGTPIITPTVIEINEGGEELSPSPSKRLKLTPRPPTSSPTQNRTTSIHAKMLTPIVKRKTSFNRDESHLSSNSFNICTPQSILKVRNLVKHNDTVSDDTKLDEMLEDYDGLTRIESSSRKSSLGLMPRKGISRTLRKPHVQFDDAVRLSSSFSDQSRKLSLNNTSIENISVDKSTLSSKDVSLMVSSKNSSTSNTDEVFYSPDSSLNESSSKEDNSTNVDENVPLINDVSSNLEISEKNIVPENDYCIKTQSPRARKSYKRTFTETEPIRSSPRINRHPSKDTTQPEPNIKIDSSIASNEDEESQLNVTKPDSDLLEAVASLPTMKQSPRLLQKVKSRKSLSRKVLEHNTFSKVLSSPLIRDPNKMMYTETSFTKVEKSSVTEKIGDTLEITTKETEEEIMNVSTLSDKSAASQHRRGRSSTYKRKLSEAHVETDTSVEADFSCTSPDFPESLKMSDSLLEYVKSRRNKPDIEQTPETKLSPKASETEENLQESLVDTARDNDEPEPEPMDVYEDLSSGAEDIEEVVRESKRPSDESKVYTELTSYHVDEFDDLEKNVFEITETKWETIEDKTVEDKSSSVKTSSNSFYFRNSDSFYVSEAEKGFLGDHSQAEISGLSNEVYIPESEKGFIADEQSFKSVKESEEVIEIGSSSDEQDSHSDTNDSRSSEKSDSDGAELNISYEHNIHIEENSRSLVDSEDSRTSEDSDNEGEPLQFVIGHIDEGNELQLNADSNSGEWVNDEQQSTDENGEDSEGEPMPRVEEEEQLVVNQLDVIEIEQKSIEVINVEVIESERDTSEIKPGDLPITSDIEEYLCQSQVVLSVEDVVEENVGIEENKEHTVQNRPEETSVKESDTKSSSPLVSETTEKKTQATSMTDLAHKVAVTKTTVEQSTNTTIFTPTNLVAEDEAEEISATTESVSSKEKVAMEQSTNTDKIETAPPEVTETKEREVYHPKLGTMKVIAEDQTKSSVSSNSTEGEFCRRDIVVEAVVHTPSKRKSEEPLIKRVTRRSSAILSQTAESDILGNLSEPDVSMTVSGYDIMDEDFQNTTCQTPGRKAYVPDILEDSNLWSTFDSDNVFTSGRRSRRSRSVTSPNRPQTLPKLTVVLDKLSEDTSKLRKTRSASVDEVVPPPRQKTRRRASTEDDVETQKPKTKEKAASTSHLPIITEEKKDESKQTRSRASSVTDYATTRRLTRRQASLIKGFETPSNVTAQDDSDVETVPDIDTIDPIKLLDKEPFQGPPDPDEEKVYEPSSPSDSTASSFSKPTKRTSRSASVTSDISIPPSTPKRRLRQSSKHIDSPSPTGVRTRSRRQSETSSITSEKSEPPSPPKRSKRKVADETGSAVSSKSTRSRANSTPSVKSDTTNSPKRQPRNRRLVSAKSDLPEITEEKSGEAGGSNEKSTDKRPLRKKKN